MIRLRNRRTNIAIKTTAILLAGILSSTVLTLPISGQSPDAPDAKPAAPEVKPAAPSAPSHYRPSRFSKRAESYYGAVWGLDSLNVKAVESGALIRFSYRILDPEKAKILNDKKFDAFLDAPTRNARLSIPSLEKVGQLRQANTEQAGRTYWMAFSNPRRTVKPGDRVNIVIGTFHANGLVVD